MTLEKKAKIYFWTTFASPFVIAVYYEFIWDFNRKYIILISDDYGRLIFQLIPPLVLSTAILIIGLVLWRHFSKEKRTSWLTISAVLIALAISIFLLNDISDVYNTNTEPMYSHLPLGDIEQPKR